MKEKNNEERISRKGKGSTKNMKMGEIAVIVDLRKESCALRKRKATKMRGPKRKIQRA